jgi:hypothetical protein
MPAFPNPSCRPALGFALCPAAPLPLQVLDWMKNPVPASQYSPSCPDAKDLETLPNAGALCVQPNDGCDYVSRPMQGCVSLPASVCVCMCVMHVR